MTQTPDLYARLKDLIQKDWFRQLVAEDRAHPNFWSIIEYGRNSYETRYSRMIRWLLDPRENHGLGPFVARELVRVAADNTDDTELLEALGRDYTADPLDGAETEALRRHRQSGGIDVLYHEKNLGLVLAIENKMYSDEHDGVGGDSQLKTYYDAVRTSREYGSYEHQVFVFLTGDGHDVPSVAEGTEAEDYARAWAPVSYEDLNEILLEAYARLGATLGAEAADAARAEHARKIIGDFVLDNRRKFRRVGTQQEDLAAFAADHEEVGAILDALGVDNDDEDADAPTEAAERIRTQFLVAFAGNLADAKRALELVYESSLPQKQNHTRNPTAQRLIRMMFNRLVGPEKALDVSDGASLGHESKERRLAPVTDPRFRALGIDTVRLTRGKGQGLNIVFGDSGYFIYISSSVSGALPNDGCTLLSYGEDPRGVSPTRVFQNSDKVFINDLDREALEERAGLTLDTIVARLEGLIQDDDRVAALAKESRSMASLG